MLAEVQGCVGGGGPIEVIPAVDVRGGGGVRLLQGGYDTVVARAGDPVALARAFAEAGAGRVHLVDLDGARPGRVQPGLVAQVAAVFPRLPASARTRSREDARARLAAAADPL